MGSGQAPNKCLKLSHEAKRRGCVTIAASLGAWPVTVCSEGSKTVARLHYQPI